ncbi:hypothetical protein [Methylomonas fluvii]|nr:hypothetical protein [Methylomonas fluvii]
MAENFKLVVASMQKLMRLYCPSWRPPGLWYWQSFAYRPGQD